jgi:hypothetical protein
VESVLKIIALSVGVTAFVILAIFGFAIWVFIPLLPAIVIFGIAVYTERKRNSHRPPAEETKEGPRKAA